MGAGAGRRVRPLAGACEPSGGVVPSRCPAAAISDAGDHNAAAETVAFPVSVPSDSFAQRGRACPVPNPTPMRPALPAGRPGPSNT